jgi:IS1 family transposase
VELVKIMLVRETRDLKTAKKLRKKIKQMGVSYDWIPTDDWDSFVAAFAEDDHKTGKEHTVGIEGNNCRLKAQGKAGVSERTCCFSKKLFDHLRAFDIAPFYINYSFV